MLDLSVRPDDNPVLVSELRREFSDLYKEKSGENNKNFLQMQENYVSARIAEIVSREGDDSGLVDASCHQSTYSLLLNPSISNNGSRIPELRNLDELAALRMVDNPDLRETIDLTLEGVYRRDDSKERRVKAGQILDYSRFAIAFHELFFRKR